MATLARQSVSLHATPVGGPAMPERPPGSYVSAESLTNEANFTGQSQHWHVIGASGVTVSKIKERGDAEENGAGGRRGEIDVMQRGGRQRDNFLQRRRDETEKDVL